MTTRQATTASDTAPRQPQHQTDWKTFWRKVCFHIDGIAIGTTVTALSDHGVFQALADSDTALAFDALVQRFDARPGYLRLAIKLLAEQGLLFTRQAEPRGLSVGVTRDGRDWLRALPAYRTMPALLQAALDLPQMIDTDQRNGPVLAALDDLLLRPATPGLPGRLAERVSQHRLGPGIAASLHALVHARRLQPLLRAAGERVPLDRLSARVGASRLALRLLESQGWAELTDDSVSLTAEGLLAAKAAPQYALALAYLPTFLRAPHSLFRPLGDTGPATTGLDQHLDRSLDIDFSGEVFLRHCRAPLLDLVRPLFDREPLERQPAIVVDTGCGDGSLLQTLYLAIAAETARGRGLERYPLLMVGADISPVAQQSTERKLAAANIPHVVLDGDIGAPERLAEALAAQGLDMKNALHVSKSVIHNRIYRAPRDEAAAGCRAPCSDGVFIAPEGGLIAPVDMEQNLCEHFRSWAPWTERHGMVVIEAHTVAPEQAAAHVGESVLTMLSASHGYSRQYLIEAHCHRALAREGGFVTLGQRDLITHPSGEALMTLDYLKPKHAVGLADLFL